MKTISKSIQALRTYAKDKPAIVQNFIEDFIRLETNEFNGLLERRDSYVNRQMRKRKRHGYALANRRD
jgi:hypothetical protein